MKNKLFPDKQVWFIVGSQQLYGEDTLKCVAEDAQKMALYLDEALDCRLVLKPTVKTDSEITSIMSEANTCDECIGVITWMHTFSPSKMWINGLSVLNKPLLHLHTQFNEGLPYDSIDMDFMNLNQSAHGDREHGYIYCAMRKSRKTVVGFWQDERVAAQINAWLAAAAGFAQSRRLKVCRFGDNMRDVAVTDGSRVSAAAKFGWNVSYYGIGDLVEEISLVSNSEAKALYGEYERLYKIVTDDRGAVLEQARYEIALERFLNKNGGCAFTDTFEDLHGLRQLPGLASQRLMEKGCGFGAEGDWKTAALLRLMKVMAGNRATTFMEDYTYDLTPGDEKILGAHMLEVCPSVARGEIRLDVQPLGIGGKQAPARLIFNGMSGDAVAVSLIDLGNRYRMIVAEMECVEVPEPMPKLPVASLMWKPKPNFSDGVRAWLMAGGAHHTVMSFALTSESMADLARMFDIECIVIGKNTDMSRFENDLMLSDFMWSRR